MGEAVESVAEQARWQSAQRVVMSATGSAPAQIDDFCATVGSAHMMNWGRTPVEWLYRAGDMSKRRHASFADGVADYPSSVDQTNVAVAVGPVNNLAAACGFCI